MERFFIPTKKIQVEHETACDLFFEYMFNEKSKPAKLTTTKTKQNEKTKDDTKPLCDKGITKKRGGEK